MKKNLILLLLLCCAALTDAQAQGINFEPAGTTWAAAVAKAKEQGKLLFVDCYTQWCGPCRAMSNNVFPQEAVGQFMNPSYISLKIDMEAGEGPELMKKWQVSAFPTFIIFNGDGNETGRFVGGSDAEKFIESVKSKSADSGNTDMDTRWAAGERNEAFLYDYLSTLNASYRRDQCNLVAEALLAGKEDSFTADSRLCEVFMRHLSNPLCPAFESTALHPEKLIEAVGEEAANRKISFTLSNYGSSLITEKEESAQMDEEKFAAWLNLMKECGRESDEIETLRLNTLIKFAEKKKDIPLYMSYIEEFCGKFDATDLELAKWATPVTQSSDQPSRNKMAALLQQRVDDLHTGKRTAQTQVGNMKLAGNLDKAMEMLIAVLKGEQPLPQK